MPARIGTTELVRDAYELLVSTHTGQLQEVNGHPYAEHPVLVATDVAEAGFEAETVAAALLHDIVEDSDVTVEQLRERFGNQVAELVEVMTDSEEVADFERRKEIHRRRVAAAGPEAAAIFAADKLDTVRGLRSAYQSDGEEVAERFKQPLDVKLRVWADDAEMVRGSNTPPPYAETLTAEVAGLRADWLSRRRRG